ALLIAFICAWPPLQALTLACPELILTQLVLVVFISEFMDWRLLEDFRPGRGTEPETRGLYIAVVRNRWNSGVLRHTGAAAPQRYRLRSVQALVDVLRSAGHNVAVMEADARLFSRLQDFIPRHALGRNSRALVVNCAGGVQGPGRLGQVPNLCEMIGVPYTGPDPSAMAVISDPLLQSQTLASQGLQTLTYRRPDDTSKPATDLPGPWIVLHRFQSDREPLKANSATALTRALRRVRAGGDEPLVATAPTGRVVRVIVIGGEGPNDDPQVLPALEYRATNRRLEAAELTDTEQRALNTAVQCAFLALRCRHYARIEAWLGADDSIGILGVRVVDLFSPRGDVATAARMAGLEFPALIQRVLGIGGHVVTTQPSALADRSPLTLYETA
ncbi:MAG: hypothetical protein RIC38_15695, partial [Chromatocurvus sp.]